MLIVLDKEHLSNLILETKVKSSISYVTELLQFYYFYGFALMPQLRVQLTGLLSFFRAPRFVNQVTK